MFGGPSAPVQSIPVTSMIPGPTPGVRSLKVGFEQVPEPGRPTGVREPKAGPADPGVPGDDSLGLRERPGRQRFTLLCRPANGARRQAESWNRDGRLHSVVLVGGRQPPLVRRRPPGSGRPTMASTTGTREQWPPSNTVGLVAAGQQASENTLFRPNYKAKKPGERS